jgi:Prokaryotic Cytochrome C oxidase subunit IV
MGSVAGTYLASSIVGIEQGAGAASTATVVLIAVALFKVRLIGIHFMDLRIAPSPLRLIFEGYGLAAFMVLVTLDLVVR